MQLGVRGESRQGLWTAVGVTILALSVGLLFVELGTGGVPVAAGALSVGLILLASASWMDFAWAGTKGSGLPAIFRLANGRRPVRNVVWALGAMLYLASGPLLIASLR